jgi:hypothetical protein
VWLDQRDDLVAGEAAWFTMVMRGAELALPIMRTIEIRYRNAQAEALARRLTRPTRGVLVIRNGDVFDRETGTIRPRTTVVVQGD